MSAEHALNGKLGAHTRWGRASRADRQRQANALAEGLQAKFEAEADPEGVLSPQERAEKADHLRRAHLLRASRAAAAARSRKSKQTKRRRRAA